MMGQTRWEKSMKKINDTANNNEDLRKLLVVIDDGNI